jgi:hypothetical protein
MSGGVREIRRLADVRPNMTRPLSANDRAIKEKELKWFKACQNLCPLFPPSEPEQNPSHARKPDIVFHHIGLGHRDYGVSPQE